MKYFNAQAILPNDLVKELQKYIQGGYLYVPAVHAKQWGEVSGYRRELEHRNQQIAAAKKAGVKVSVLAETYSLSESSVRKIICQQLQKELGR